MIDNMVIGVTGKIYPNRLSGKLIFKMFFRGLFGF